MAGIIRVRYDQYEGDFNVRFGHLYYDQPFSYFHLVVEYRFVGDSLVTHLINGDTVIQYFIAGYDLVRQ